MCIIKNINKQINKKLFNFRKCADPLNIHQNIVKSNLHVVTSAEHKQII